MIPLALMEGGYKLEFLDRTTIRITKNNGKSYEIDLENKTCSCPSFFYNGGYTENKPCKHIQLLEDLYGSDWKTALKKN